MIRTKEDLWEFLINSKMVISVDDKFALNQTVINCLKKGSKSSNFCKDYPDNFKGLSDDLIYTKVMELTNIPLMYKGDISYFVRTKTKSAVAALKKVLHNEDIYFDRFIKSTRNFYASEVAIPGFAKYLTENLWETIYGAGEEENNKGSRKGVI